MKAHDFRNLNMNELASRIESLRSQYFKKQAEVLSGKEKNHAVLKSMRADIARAETVYKEQQKEVVAKKA